MVLQESAPVVAVLTTAAAVPTTAVVVPTASIVVPLMALVWIPVSAVAALTLFGLPRPCLPPGLAPAMAPRH